MSRPPLLLLLAAGLLAAAACVFVVQKTGDTTHTPADTTAADTTRP